MNGQTDKFVGILPESKGKATILYILSTIGFTILAIIVCLIIINS
jgi:hypothetical protein